MAGYDEIDWNAEGAALARHFESRGLTAAQVASLLEFCLAELVGALARDPAEAYRIMGELAARMPQTAAEHCRSPTAH